MQSQTSENSERIAKRIARAGVASRRAVERMIEQGRVMLNGKVVATPATLVGPSDVIAVDEEVLSAPEPARLWLYHKPAGLITSHRDEKGRKTVFEALPEDMARVLSVGRLDMNSEGLLLLTNDGGLKRKLELPSTGWLRRYRVRARGILSKAGMARLKEGITVEGTRFRPMEVGLDRSGGANIWLTIGIREGKNREIKRALGEIGLEVNRLIRISYGPFCLDTLPPGALKHVPARILKDQLGNATSP